MRYLKRLILSQVLVTLIFPITLMAISPCEEANNYVAEASYLDDLLHRTQQHTLLQQALTLCPDHSEAHTHLGMILEKENNDIQAIYHYQQALTKRPNYAKAWVGLGDTYYKQGQLPLSFNAYLHVCTKHAHARQRVAELLRDNRYRIAEGDTVLNYESLSLLYDRKRLQQFHQMASRCRQNSHSKTIRAILQPVAVFRQNNFEVNKPNLMLVSEAQLDRLAIVLIDIGAKKILIRGHSDSQPVKGKTPAKSHQLNWQLSRDRAKSVKEALVLRGISKRRIKTYSYGDSRPLVKGNNKAAWAKNRRVEIEVNLYRRSGK
jgi:outer membrane protein OmpA-like peptidoglycan-associated protein